LSWRFNMKQGKKEVIGRVVVISLISIVVLISAWIGVGIVTAAQNNNEEEEITTQMNQGIEKYFDLENDQVLLQQKIVVNTNRNDVKKESEKLLIHVPMIQGKKPETLNVLADGKLVEDQFCHYDAQKNLLNIAINGNISVYKIIYGYQDMTAEQQEIELYTKAYTKVENVEEEIEIQDEKKVEINPIGQKISIQGEITKEIYKGYLYEAKENKTVYNENYIIEVSNTQKVEAMNISKEKEVFTYEVGNEEEKNKMEMSTNDSIYYTKTMINKEQMLRILGEEGKITFQKEQGEIIAELTKDSQEDENGNMLVNYEDKERKTIKVITTKPIQLGEIKLIHEKVIDANIGYAKQEIEKIEKLENTIRVNEASNVLQMSILNPKVEASIHMNQIELSTLQKNENIQMIVILRTNASQYALYKNPVIDILLPEEIEIDIKEITQLNFEEIMQVKNAEIKENDEGRKIIRITLEGEQQSYSKQLTEGIQIAIKVDVTISNKVPSKEANIEVSCKNENTGGETVTTQCPLKINSKYGVLMINKMENYNQAQDTVETVDNKDLNVQLDIGSDEKTVKQTTQIMNNYENSISKLSMIGNITEDKQAIDMSFQEIIVPEDKNAKIYYADTVQTAENSKKWKENREEVEKVKSYKIVLEDEMQPEESLQITYLLDVPENLNPAKESYIKNTLTYENLDNTEMTISNVTFTTRNQQAEMFSANKTFEKNGIKVEISAITGNQYLKDGDTVKEGQGIRYKIRVTNVSNADLSNIVLEATNTNAIYYNRIAYEADANGAIVTKYKVEEDESLTAKTLKIESLQAGETKEVSYQISVKEVEEANQTLTGEIRITADDYEEEVMQNITNQIEQGSIKATLRFLYSEDVPIYANSDIAISANVKNISREELQNVIVEIPVAEGLEFSEDNLFMDEEDPYEFIEYKDGAIKIKIPQIATGETIYILMKLIPKQLDLTKEKENISQYFKVIDNEIEYISNDIEKTVQQIDTEITVNQTTNREERTIRDGDAVKFFVTLENKGVIGKRITIRDKIPQGLQINSAIVKIKETERAIEYNNNSIEDTIEIQPKEIIELEIDTTVNKELVVNKEIENYIEVRAMGVNTKSNIISFFIEVEQEDDKDDELNEDFNVEVDNEGEYKKDPSNGNNNNNNNNNDNNNNNNNNNNNDNQNNDDNDNGNRYKISGIAWVDSNTNGQRDSEESKVSNMPIFLVNEETGKELSGRTKEDGSYSFENLKEGRYVVIFQYDSNKYTVTTYQKEGVAPNINSDVMYSVRDEVSIAKTKTLELKSQDLENIDAGFIEGKKFDLKIDKSINQVTVQNSKGTKVNTYQNSKLAKVEIDAKQIENSNISIKYNIAVTNQGEVDGYVDEIIDYLPKDLTFSQERNPSWYQLKGGSIATKELSKEIIHPGETKEIALIVSKKMTQENTGTITNKARIEKYSSYNKVEDINTNNDESQADVIVSVRTGRIILYISLAITIVMMIAVSVYFIKKKVL